MPAMNAISYRLFPTRRYRGRRVLAQARHVLRGKSVRQQADENGCVHLCGHRHWHRFARSLCHGAPAHGPPPGHGPSCRDRGPQGSSFGRACARHACCHSRAHACPRHRSGYGAVGLPSGGCHLHHVENAHGEVGGRHRNAS